MQANHVCIVFATNIVLIENIHVLMVTKIIEILNQPTTSSLSSSQSREQSVSSYVCCCFVIIRTLKAEPVAGRVGHVADPGRWVGAEIGFLGSLTAVA